MNLLRTLILKRNVCALVTVLNFTSDASIAAEQVIVENLTAPTYWDNASNPAHYGQSFVSNGLSIVAIDFFQGAPGGARCIGSSAHMKIFSIDDVAAPVEIGTATFDGRFLPCGSAQPATVTFPSPIPTLSGSKYAFIVVSANWWDMGLTGASSTYSGGSQAGISGDISNGYSIIEFNGRDASFRVRGILPSEEIGYRAFVDTRDINGDLVRDFATLTTFQNQLFLSSVDGASGTRLKRIRIRSNLTGGEFFELNFNGVTLNVLISQSWGAASVEKRDPISLGLKRRLSVQEP
jgi:hypothetical protein